MHRGLEEQRRAIEERDKMIKQMRTDQVIRGILSLSPTALVFLLIFFFMPVILRCVEKSRSRRKNPTIEV